MAPKKSKSKSVPAAKVQKKNEVKGQAKNSGGIIIGVIAAVIAFIVIESAVVMNKQIKMNKKPKMVGVWSAKSNKTVAAVQVFGNSVFCVDTSNNQIVEYDKASGALTGIYQTDSNALSGVKLKDGTVLVLTADNKIIKYVNQKPAGQVGQALGIQKMVWLSVDSQDNIYISDASKGVIVKCDSGFNKLAEIGAGGSDKEKLQGVGRTFVGPSDEIYTLTGKPYWVKIYDKNGKFMNGWLVKGLEKVSDLEALAINPQGDIYMNDFNGSKVIVYSGKGKIKYVFSVDADGRFKMQSPGFIAGGLDGLIVISSTNMGICESIK